MMITELTAKQEKGIKEWRDHCLAIGRDTSPVDREATMSVFNDFYKRLGYKPPRYWWCQSPFSARTIINLFKNGTIGIIKKEIGNNIEDNLGTNIRVNIEDNIWMDFGVIIENNIWANIEAKIEGNIWDNTWANIETKIKDYISANIGANIRDDIAANIRGNIVNNIWDNIQNNILSNIRANIETNIWDNIWGNIKDNIRANIGGNIVDNIRANIRANIAANIGGNIGGNIGDNIRDNLWNNIKDNIRVNIRDNLWNNIRANTKTTTTCCWAQHDINWIAYFLYYLRYGLLVYDKNFEVIGQWFRLAQSAGWCYTFENTVFVCEKPNELHLNREGRLHKDLGPALKYSDDYCLWMLNGVRVPQWLVEKRDTEIDASKIVEIDNVDVRREFIRKVGIDRIVYKLGAKTIDTKTYNIGGYELPYQLLEIDIRGTKYKALKMQNPSLSEVWHVEFVPDSCKSVLDAWNFRVGLEPQQIDKKGADWYLHGDVVIKPRNARVFKQFPKLIA